MARRERDGKSRAAEFVKVYRFMTEGMGLTGTSLLVYARIFGFCKDTGGSFWESRRGTAEFLGISERQVNRVIAGLESHGLIECLGEEIIQFIMAADDLFNRQERGVDRTVAKRHDPSLFDP